MGSFLIVLPLLAISAASLSLPQSQHANVIAELSNELGVQLIKKLSVAGGNVFFSPLSISTALAMLFYGTRGKSADEMRRALGYQEAGLADNQVHSAFQSLVETFSENSGGLEEYLLYLANAMYTQKDYPILEEYKTGLQEIYKAVARNVDFTKQPEQAIQEINDWVKKNTNNQITELLREVQSNTVMVLLNAVYFKGTWATKFENTTEGIFFNKGLKSQSVKIPMMSSDRNVLYTQLEGAQAIELPYKGEDISMIIVLPDAPDGLQKVVQNATPNTLKNIRKSARETEVKIKFPKFKLEYQKTLNTVLQDLGIKDIFQESADLTGISAAGRLVVSEVVHKAVVEVNEEGTQASAATAVVITKLSAARNIRFVADHPFCFAIIDKRNDLVLFQGHVNEL